MTKLFKVLIFRVFEFDNNKIIDNGNNKLNKKLSKFKKSLMLKYIFIFLRLTFIDIQIKTKVINFLKKNNLEILNIKLIMQSFCYCLSFHNLKTFQQVKSRKQSKMVK